MIFKKILLLVYICIISGCAIASSPGGHNPQKKNTKEEEIFQLQETLALKNTEIQNLNALIKEKDAKIEKLKNKLSTFGVFE